MKKIYITADSQLTVTSYEQPKISLGDTAVIELTSSVNNDYALRVDFVLPNENVSYLRPMKLIDTNLWSYELPNSVLSAVSSKNKAVTLQGYITAYNVINNTINEAEGFINKLGNYTIPSELPVGTVGEDYAAVAFEEDGITANENIWQYTATGWEDSGLKEKLTSVASTTINIAVDKFIQNTQELVDATITDLVLENLAENNADILDHETRIITLENEMDEVESDIVDLQADKVDKTLPYSTATLSNLQEVYINDDGTAKKATLLQLETFVTRNITGMTITRVANREALDLIPIGERKANKLYLVPLETELEDNISAEYYWDTDNLSWELYGTTRVKLFAENVIYNGATVEDALNTIWNTIGDVETLLGGI